jgi:transmembrane sensor
VKTKNHYRELLKRWEPPFDRTQDEVWPHVEKRVDALPERPHGRMISLQKWGRAAAAAAVIGIGAFVFWPDSETYSRIINDVGAHREIVLPDRSVVTLAVGSVLAYPEKWNERSVELEGRAFFEVTKGSAFTVRTNAGLVEVLGTSFDVLSRESEFMVACHTGKVRVGVSDHSIELAPGQRARLESGTLIRETFFPESNTWMKGEFTFENESLIKVFAGIEQCYGVEIRAEIAENRLYTGTFTSENLEDALESVCLPMGLAWKFQSDKVIAIAARSADAAR